MFTKPSFLLRVEGGTILALSVFLYRQNHASWLLFTLLFLAPDLFMLGYLASVHVGAAIYNFAHTLLTPVVLLAIGILTGKPHLLPLVLIWTAHIGFDRLLGFGDSRAHGIMPHQTWIVRLENLPNSIEVSDLGIQPQVILVGSDDDGHPVMDASEKSVGSGGEDRAAWMISPWGFFHSSQSPAIGDLFHGGYPTHETLVLFCGLPAMRHSPVLRCSQTRSILYHCASWTQRKPKAPERSMLGAIIRSFPCSVSLYACGKYQMDP